MTLLSLVVAVPLGIFSAIYLTEYARRGNKLVKVVRLTTETLQGIPSIVYGLFGYLFFLVQLQWGYSLLAGAMTLAIMILPLIMRTTEEAVLSVPDGYREGSFAPVSYTHLDVYKRQKSCWGEEARPGKLTHETWGCFSRYSATACAFWQWRSMRTGSDSRPRLSMKAAMGCGVQPKSRINCARALLM